MIAETEYKVDKKLTQDLSFFTTAGFSMWPFLKGGSKVIVKKVPMEDLAVGDIILYRPDNRTVCHRLVKKAITDRECLLYARGDNSLQRPEAVTGAMYLGKAIGVLNNGATINFTDRRHRLANRTIVMIAPAVSLMVKMVTPLYRKLKKYRFLKV